MDLILWRHADAEPGIPDSGRRLTTKGVRQAAKMGAWLEQHLPSDARVLVSPAVRAQQTAAGLARGFTTVAALAPGAAAEEVLAAAGWPDRSGTVLVVGHQPTLGEIAGLLLTGTAGSWPVKKAAVWWLTQRAAGGEAALRAVVGPDLV